MDESLEPAAGAAAEEGDSDAWSRAANSRVVRAQLLSAFAAVQELQRTVHGVNGQSANLADSLPDVDCSRMGDHGLIRVIDVMREAGEHLHELRVQHDRLQEELARRSARRSSAREMERRGLGQNRGSVGGAHPHSKPVVADPINNRTLRRREVRLQ